jgi:TPR repeat protein
VVADSALTRACDRLAADPIDESLPAAVTPVVDDALDAQGARTACLLATSGHPGHQRSLYQLARALLASGDVAAGESLLLDLAEKGYAAAQIRFAMLVFGGPVDSERRDTAVAYLELATESGSAIAPRVLADHLSGTFGDQSRARLRPEEFYEIAASRGDIEGMFEAGYRLISSSIGNDDDLSRGLGYLTAAAEAGHAGAMIRLSNHYMSDPRGRDTALGIDWLSRAAEAGNARAATRLVTIYSRGGSGIAPDPVKAAATVLALAGRGEPFYMVQAGYYHETGFGVVRDPARAARYYFRALGLSNVLVLRRDAREWDRETARALQRLLEAAGHYSGPIDGIVGPGTRAAMSRHCTCSDGRNPIAFDRQF